MLANLKSLGYNDFKYIPYGGYRKSEDADAVDQRQQVSAGKVRFHTLSLRTIHFNGKIKIAGGRFKTDLAPVTQE